MTDGVATANDGEVLVCTISRPDRGNSLRHQDTAALADALEAVSRDGGARAVLLRSEGRNFCAGADLTGTAVGGPNKPAGTSRGKPAAGHLRQQLEAGAHRLILAVWQCRVPVVAAVQGRAAGLGCNLAAACDLVVAGRSASFSEPFVRLGFSVDSAGSWLLSRRIGLTRAAAMLLRGIVLDASQAEGWGLVAEVVDDAELEKTAAELAAELAAGPTLALSLTKGLLQRHSGSGVGLAEALAEEAMAVELSVRSDDFKEGMLAFGEKRPPHFTGR